MTAKTRVRQWARHERRIGLLWAVLVGTLASAGTVGPEFEMDAPLQGKLPLVEEQTAPAVAFDGTQFLVVWQDSRASFGHDIYAARVLPDGTVLDPGGFPISSVETDEKLTPAVAFDGENFLVVWSDLRNHFSIDLYGARVSRSGQVLDPDGFAIATSARHEARPAVACQALQDCLVSWEGGEDIYAARVRTDGTAHDPWSYFPISEDSSREFFPSVATTGVGYLVAFQRNWTDAGAADIHGALVGADGTLTGSPFLISGAANNQVDPAVASDGTQYLVVWGDGRAGGSFAMYAARISAAGSVLEPEGLPLGSSGHCGYPTAGFDGMSFVAAWSCGLGSASIQAARLTPAGGWLGQFNLSSTVARFPAIAAAGPSLLVWEDDRHGGTDLYGTRLATDGTVLNPAGLFITYTLNGIGNQQVNAVAGFGGGQYLVVWEDFRDGTSSNLYAVRMAPDGTVLDAEAFAVSRAAGPQVPVRIAYDGSRFLVVWRDQRNGNWDIYGARVGLDGTVLDPEGLALVSTARDELEPELAYGGGTFFLVWADDRDSLLGDEVRGARVGRDGTVLDPGGFAISSSEFHQRNPAVDFDGTDFFVVWEDRRNFLTTGTDLYGARVTTTGTVRDTMGLAVHVGSGDQVNPELAFGGSLHLVTWQTLSTDASGNPTDDIHAARVGVSGTVLDTAGLRVSGAARAQRLPRVTHDGQHFVVAWLDGRSGSGDDVYGARVGATGVVMDPTGLVLSAHGVSEAGAGIASDGAGRNLVTFHRYVAEAPYQKDRIRARLLQ